VWGFACFLLKSSPFGFFLLSFYFAGNAQRKSGHLGVERFNQSAVKITAIQSP
jgi:hypothetical protein